MSRGALGWTLLVVALAAGVIAAIFYFAPDEPARVNAPPARELAPEARNARDFADAACVRVDLATQAIRANASAATVRAELAAARRLASAALRRDARFTALSGGIAALDEAVRRNDADSASLGLTVVLNACELSR